MGSVGEGQHGEGGGEHRDGAGAEDHDSASYVFAALSQIGSVPIAPAVR